MAASISRSIHTMQNKKSSKANFTLQLMALKLSLGLRTLLTAGTSGALLGGPCPLSNKVWKSYPLPGSSCPPTPHAKPSPQWHMLCQTCSCSPAEGMPGSSRHPRRSDRDWTCLRPPKFSEWFLSSKLSVRYSRWSVCLDRPPPRPVLRLSSDSLSCCFSATSSETASPACARRVPSWVSYEPWEFSKRVVHELHLPKLDWATSSSLETSTNPEPVLPAWSRKPEGSKGRSS